MSNAEKISKLKPLFEPGSPFYNYTLDLIKKVYF